MSRCLGVHLQHLIPSEKINLTRDQIFIFSRCEKNRQNDVVKKTAEKQKLYLLGAMISPTPTTLVVTPSLNSSMQTFEGQLNKFTNVVKGWQYRWFVLSGETGNLDYYLMDEGM